jgi:hypothetical protein
MRLLSPSIWTSSNLNYLELQYLNGARKGADELERGYRAIR